MIFPYLKFDTLNLLCLRVNDWGGSGGPSKLPALLTYDKRALEFYKKALAKIDLSAYDRKDIARFVNSVEEAMKLTKKIEPLAKRFVYHIIPQSHIDMAWLWCWPETVDVCCKGIFFPES